jgi:hypothetical protein
MIDRSINIVQICASTFDLRSVAVHCGSTTTCEEFGQAILVGDDVSLASSPTVTGDDGHVRWPI